MAFCCNYTCYRCRMGVPLASATAFAALRVVPAVKARPLAAVGVADCYTVHAADSCGPSWVHGCGTRVAGGVSAVSLRVAVPLTLPPCSLPHMVICRRWRRRFHVMLRSSSQAGGAPIATALHLAPCGSLGDAPVTPARPPAPRALATPPDSLAMLI